MAIKNGIMVWVVGMLKKIKDININYLDYGKNSNITLVLLHGWGQNIEMMLPIAKYFQTQYRLIVIDLPGFGRSDVPSKVLSIEDYADLINELLTEISAKNIVLIGHSFGGQIALFYSSKYNVKKLVLLASPFRPHKGKKTFKSRIFKLIKKTPILKNHLEYFKTKFGSTDYRNARGVMRDILVKKVNLDMSSCVKNIKIPTLIVWGDMDKEVPLSDANYLHQNISNSELIIYKGATHYAYLEHLEELCLEISKFIERK